MATIGSLNVAIKATTGKFEAGMKKAQGQVTRFKGAIGDMRGKLNGLSGSFANLGTLGAGLGAAFTVSHLANLSKQVDMTQKFADRLDIATEQLQEFHFAAGLTGVSSNTMNMALQRMTRRIAEAAQGTGEAKGALEEMGLSAQALVDMGPDKAFLHIADSISELSNQSDRVRLAFKLFDSEGVSLVQTMAKGSRGIQQMGKEAQRLGLIVDETSSRRIEGMNDSISVLMQSLDGLGKSVLGLTAGPLSGLAITLTEVLNVATRIGNFLSGTFKGSVALASSAIGDLTRGLEKTIHFLTGIDARMGGSTLQAFGEILGDEAAGDFNQALGLADDQIKSIGNSARMTGNAIEEMAKKTESMADATNRLKQAEFDALDRELESTLSQIRGILESPEIERLRQQEAKLGQVLAQNFSILTDREKDQFQAAIDTLVDQRKAAEADLLKKDEFDIPRLLRAPEDFGMDAERPEFGPAFDSKAQKVVDSFNKTLETETKERKLGMARAIDTNLIDLAAFAKTGQTVEEKQLKETKKATDFLAQIAGSLEDNLTLA